MADELSDYVDLADTIPREQDLDISDILESLSRQEENEIDRLEEKLADVRQQLENEREVLEDNLEVIYRQIEEVQDQLRELDVPGYKSDSAIRKERELRKRLEDLYSDVRRERREWRRDRQKPLEEKRELEELLSELDDSQDIGSLL